MRPATADLLPWRCHVCRRAFAELEGGSCSRCGQRTCPVHLVRFSGSPSKPPMIMVCTECLNPVEKERGPLSTPGGLLPGSGPRREAE